MGSSPRVRGKLLVPAMHCRTVRLIPARAGKTSTRESRSQRRRAHPRACGENWSEVAGARWRAGSSPRVRGKLARLCAPHLTVGLIPARAGKTAVPSAEPPLGRAHPRACGENFPPASFCSASAGSSPRVRGKPGPCSDPPTPARLIPARAGKTRRSGRRPTGAPAHPRACGENVEALPRLHNHQGSSPRVRGKLRAETRWSLADRLIPARAGKTC